MRSVLHAFYEPENCPPSGSPAQTAIGLLQDNDVGIDLAQDGENTLGVAPAIQSDRLSYVVADNPHYSQRSGAQSRARGELIRM